MKTKGNVVHKREWLKKLRKKKGITQREIADSLGIGQQYYSLIERGERQKELGLLLAAKISSLLKISLPYIIAMEAEDCCSQDDLGAAREFVYEDGNGICNQMSGSVANIF